MKRYRNATRGEWVKIFTTRSWWVLALVMVLYVAFTAAVVAGSLAVSGNAMGGGVDLPFGGARLVRMVYGLGPTVAYLFPVLLGALSVTSEYRHHTLGSTFVWNGSRSAVLGAKVSTQFLMGLLYGFLALAAAVLGGVFFFIQLGETTALGSGETWLMFLRATLAMGLWGVVGVGIGVLVRNQAAAIVIVLVFTQFLEPVLRMVGALNETVANITTYLPGAASDALTGASFYTAVLGGGSYQSLTVWSGGLLLAGYAIALVSLGLLLRWRGDVS